MMPVTNTFATQTIITTSSVEIMVIVPVIVTKGIIVTRWMKGGDCDVEEGGDARRLKQNKGKQLERRRMITIGEEDEKKWAKVLVAAAASVCY
jgi:hypothetical protein